MLGMALLLLGVPGSGVPGDGHWLQDIQFWITKLISADAGQLVDIGSIELSFFALISLISMVGRWQLNHMNIGSHAVNFRIGDFFEWLIKLMLCSSMLFYYNNPLPGSALNLHQIPQAVGSAIAINLNDKSDDELSNRITAAMDGTVQPTGLDLSGIVIYFSVVVVMGVLEVGMFVINAGGFVGYALFAYFGPLLIPCFMTKYFSGKFWGWVNGLTIFGMYGAVSAAIAFIWLHVLIGFFDHTLAGNFSIVKWAGVLFLGLVPVSVGFVYAMFKVPSWTNHLFGGVGGPAQQATDSMVSGLTKLAVAAL